MSTITTTTDTNTPAEPLDEDMAGVDTPEDVQGASRDLMDDEPRVRPIRIVRTNPMIRWLLLPLVLSTFLMAAGYIVRTQAFLGPAIGTFIRAQAQKHNIDLFIQDVRPKGFFGVRLSKVRARVQRGPYILDAQLDAVDINPDLLKSIQYRRPIPSAIHLNKGTITLSRDANASTASAKTKASNKAASASMRAMLDQISIVGRDLKVQFRAGRSFKSTRPMEMKRIEASIGWLKDPLPQKLQAYGKLPDGTPFSLSTRPVKGKAQARMFVLKPEGKTKIDRWFDNQLPFQMSVNQIEVCAGCLHDEMRFNQVWLKLPTFGKGLDVTAKDSKIQWDRGKASLLLPGVRITGMDTKDAKNTSIQLTQTTFMFDTVSGSHTGDLTLKESSGGKLGVSWLWDGPQRLLSGTLEAQKFSLTPFFGLWGTNSFFQKGTLHGTIDGTLDLNQHLVHTTTKMTIADAIGHWPRLSPKKVHLNRVHLKSESILDIKSRAINLLSGSVQMGKAKPIHLHGRLQHANAGWVFSLDLQAAQVDAEILKNALPTVLTEGIKDTRFGGHVGLTLHTSGHTAFAESLRVKFDVQDDLEVVHDALGVAKLNTAGAPNWPSDKFSPPIKPTQWISLENLPPELPRTLTAAEDAQFFRHNGFDPLGFERAMVHNLRVKRMERGGSTITQQVVKNVFLSTKRTLARKLQEAYLTWHIEKQLPKKRILEIYLNIAEWGPGVRGLEQAAQYYFKRPATELEIEHVALLGTILPGPKLYGRRVKAGQLPSSRLTKFEHILSNLRFLGMIESSTYREWMRDAKKGNVAGLSLSICADDDTAPKGTPPCTAKTR